jgi:hypothetical protein
MESLLSRLANIFIQACKKHVLSVDGEDPRGNLWKKSPVKLCEAFQHCVRLRLAFEDHYRCRARTCVRGMAVWDMCMWGRGCVECVRRLGSE